MANANVDDVYCWNKRIERILAWHNLHSRIYLREKNLTDKDIPMIVKEALINKQCIELDLSSNRLTSAGVQLLADALDPNVLSLEMIDLANNKTGDEGVQSIITALRVYPLLTHLRLGRNNITDNSAQYVAELFSGNRRLILLELEHNSLTSQGVIVLAQAVPHSNLKYFYIGNNRQVNDACGEALRNMIQKSTELLAISLDNIEFSQKWKDKLQQAAKAKHRLTLSF
jgi:Ran GTPase-activating protein (RanGAP) involved in mRNA processing and transport